VNWEYIFFKVIYIIFDKTILKQEMSCDGLSHKDKQESVICS